MPAAFQFIEFLTSLACLKPNAMMCTVLAALLDFQELRDLPKHTAASLATLDERCARCVNAFFFGSHLQPSSRQCRIALLVMLQSKPISF